MPSAAAAAHQGGQAAHGLERDVPARQGPIRCRGYTTHPSAEAASEAMGKQAVKPSAAGRTYGFTAYACAACTLWTGEIECLQPFTQKA